MFNKILIIDDQKAKFLLLSEILRELFPGCKLEHQRNFRSAIAQTKVTSWDLAFLDMSFDVNDNPSERTGFVGLAGLQVLQHLHRSDIMMPVIIYTAHSSFEDQQQGKIDGIEALNKHVKKWFPDICLGCVHSGEPMELQKKNIRELTDAYTKR